MGSSGNKPAGYNPRCRRAAGFARGGGRGFGRYPDEPFRPGRREYLEAVARNLEEELKAMRDQIDKLQSKP